MMKYPDSSIDHDIQFLFRLFDRRICIGTDHPWYTHEQVRQRFETFGQGVSEEKLRNIGYGNLMKFLDWNSDFL